MTHLCVYSNHPVLNYRPSNNQKKKKLKQTHQYLHIYMYIAEIMKFLIKGKLKLINVET